MEHQTGNPVFDYRADFRKFADKLQRILIYLGLLLFTGCGVAFLFAKITDHLRTIVGFASIGGIFLVICGIAWAFYWRKKLQAEFRDKFGPK